MQINVSTIKDIFRGLKIEFDKAFGAAQVQYKKVAMHVKSNSKYNTYTWLKSLPKMQRWVGDKHVENLERDAYKLMNDDFEVTVAVDRNDIEDGELGNATIQSQIGGTSAAELPDDLVFALPHLGFTTECFDGQYFFDADHEVGDASVSNTFGKKLKAGSVAEAKASYGAARTAMKSLKDEHGRSLKVSPNVLLVPPALEDVANTIINSEKFDDGSINPYKGTAEVVVVAMESDDEWFLLDTTKPVKPFIYQERKKPVFVSQTSLENDDVFNRREFKFGAEARAQAGFGFWQLAYGSTGTIE
ncbi:MAG: Mu-like prophage major head subunit gpT family protein [Kangiella sp.]|nr:Mu-like prophage major head subunit gpT family protein [Kangiella sp.]MCW9028513.1 Mu-like prophage major head subunit gpT family protein [Kangiella sp.]